MTNQIAGILLGGLTLSGCVQTPYRYEVHDTGEGSVRVDRVPKDSSATVATTPSPATAAVQSQSDQQKIDELEARVRALSEENQKLKQAAPAATPAKE